MKSLILSLCLLFGAITTYAQNYQVATFNKNATPTYGVKIKTNLPYLSGNQMPTIIIEGFNYITNEPIGLIITYYIYNNVFYQPKVSSFGAYTPAIYLAIENSKVVIFIDDKAYCQRFTARAFAQGMPGDTSINYAGWTVVDEALLGTATQKTLVPYQNRFAGTVNLPGTGIWNSSGSVGIGTNNPGTYKLAVEGTIGARKVKVTQAAWADFVFRPDYQLPSLQDVERFIAANGHLKDIPTETEVKEQGVDVGEMQKSLLQKVEELTLYLIEANKRNEQLEKRVAELEKKSVPR